MIKQIWFSFLLSCPIGYALHATDYSWNNATLPSQSWDTGANWTPTGVPNGTGDTATFSLPITGAQSVTLASPAISPTLNSLTFNFASQSYTITGSPQTLTFAGSSPKINLVSGTHVIDVPLVLDGNTIFNLSGGNLTCTPNCTIDPTVSVGSLTIEGTDSTTFTLEGMNSSPFFSPKTTTINGGTININSGASFSNAIGAGFPLTLTINGGVLNNDGFVGENNSSLIDGGEIFTINGGTINNSVSSQMGFQSTFTINGGTFTNASTLMGRSSPNFIINGGTFTNTGTMGRSSQQFTINEGTFTNTGLIGTSGDLLIIHGGTFFNSTTATIGESVATVVIDGGTFTNTGGANIASAADSFTFAGGTILNENSSFVGSQSNILFSGGSFTNTSSSTLALTAGSFTMTGGVLNNEATSTVGPTVVSINGGTFINNGTTIVNSGSTLTVAGSGLVQGSGVFESSTSGPFSTVNSGTIEPGSQTSGTLTLSDGNYTQSSAGNLLITVNDPSSSTLLLTSSASLNGTLQVKAGPQFNMLPGQTVTVLNAPSGVSGKFSQVEGLNFATVAPVANYFPTSVAVSFVPAFNTYIGGISQTIFSSINHINIRLGREMKKMRSNFFSMPSSTQETATAYFSSRTQNRRPILRQNTPIVLASNLVNDFEDYYDEYSPLEEDQWIADDDEEDQWVADQDPSDRTFTRTEKSDRPWNFYVGPIGSLGDVKNKSTQVGFDYWSAGALAGFDYAFSQVGLGLLLDYERIDATVNQNWGNFHIDQAHASLYSTYAPEHLPELSLSGVVGGGYEWYDIHRQTGTVTPETAKGTPQSMEVDALFAIEYAFTKSQFSFTPLASLQYIFLDTGSYQEHNAGLFNLHVHSQKAQSLRSTLGAAFSYTWQWNHSSLTPAIDLGWQREYLDKNRSLSFAPINVLGPTSSIGIIGAGRNTLLVGFDLAYTFYDRFAIEGSYDFEWNSLFLDHFFYLGFNTRF